MQIKSIFLENTQPTIPSTFMCPLVSSLSTLLELTSNILHKEIVISGFSVMVQMPLKQSMLTAKRDSPRYFKASYYVNTLSGNPLRIDNYSRLGCPIYKVGQYHSSLFLFI